VAYEAQAAIMLEMAAGTQPLDDLATGALLGKAARGPIAIDSLIRMVVNDLKNGDPVGGIAAKFHAGLAELFISAVKVARDETGLNRVGLSGGVFQNARFFEYILERLENEKFDVLCHRHVPTNDGGLALGQVVVADAVLRQKKTP
ncbi:MAG: carbamoyltransferase HypF, partial [candidate division Zixibacteria bacterium]|nr:carbamoyltransferase HypF [candidate division Zixibacteria bacterium]